MSLTREEYTNLEANLIANMLEENNRIRDLLESKKKKVPQLTNAEKKLILSELKDIRDIEFLGRSKKTTSEKTSVIVFHFKPISLYLDPGQRTGDVERRKLPFYYLWKLGFIDFKTSPSRVTMTIFENGNLSFVSNYDDTSKRNFHDWGLDCWGGWRGVIEGLMREKKFYDAVLHIASRMKQATVNDSISSYDKMCQFTYESKESIKLNDQEVEFFETEIKWLLRNNFESEGTELKRFVDYNDGSNLSFVDFYFRGRTYRLLVSREMKRRLEAR